MGDDATHLQGSCWANTKAKYLAAEGEEGRTREMSDWGPLPASLPTAQNPFPSPHGELSMAANP